VPRATQELFLRDNMWSVCISYRRDCFTSPTFRQRKLALVPLAVLLETLRSQRNVRCVEIQALVSLLMTSVAVVH
jgi:hypothetical protein